MNQPTPHPSASRTILAGIVGNTLEWYDFALFGYFSPIIGAQFFPSGDRASSLLQAFGVFALGFLVRPLGGILFGRLGDRFGRKRALELSVLLMVIPTALFGLLPSYAQIGLLAPLLVTLVRICQGISVGGEYVASVTFLCESAPAHRRGFFGSWNNFGVILGLLLGSAVAALTNLAFSPDTLASWGWRIPFVAGILGGVFGIWLRTGMPETIEFQNVVKSGQVDPQPLRTVLRTNLRGVLLTCGISLVGKVGFNVCFVWLPVYLSTIRQPALTEALVVNTLAMMVLVALIPLSGWLSDLIGRRPLLLAGNLGFLLLAYPSFLILAHPTFETVLGVQIVWAILLAMVMGATPAAIVDLFPTSLRASGMGLGENANAILGGISPVLATWLIQSTHSPQAPAVQLMLFALVTILSILLMQPQHQRQRVPGIRFRHACLD